MPHIHDLIDFTVCCYIVYENKVLLVHHKKLNMWVPPGGHIELDEDSDQALQREIKEETGLEVEILGDRPDVADIKEKPSKALLVPMYMDIHHFNDTHRHQNLVFFGKAANDDAILEEREHSKLCWFTANDLKDEQYDLSPYIRFYAEQALERLS